MSSLRWASQLSCRVSISSFRRSFCSVVSDSVHLALSKGVSFAAAVGLGAPKKDVMLLLALGFLASRAADVASVALRFRLIVIMSVRKLGECSLMVWSRGCFDVFVVVQLQDSKRAEFMTRIPK